MLNQKTIRELTLNFLIALLFCSPSLLVAVEIDKESQELLTKTGQFYREQYNLQVDITAVGMADGEGLHHLPKALQLALKNGQIPVQIKKDLPPSLLNKIHHALAVDRKLNAYYQVGFVRDKNLLALKTVSKNQGANEFISNGKLAYHHDPLAKEYIFIRNPEMKAILKNEDLRERIPLMRLLGMLFSDHPVKELCEAKDFTKVEYEGKFPSERSSYNAAIKFSKDSHIMRVFISLDEKPTIEKIEFEGYSAPINLYVGVFQVNRDGSVKNLFSENEQTTVDQKVTYQFSKWNLQKEPAKTLFTVRANRASKKVLTFSNPSPFNLEILNKIKQIQALIPEKLKPENAFPQGVPPNVPQRNLKQK